VGSDDERAASTATIDLVGEIDIEVRFQFGATTRLEYRSCLTRYETLTNGAAARRAERLGLAESGKKGKKHSKQGKRMGGRHGSLSLYPARRLCASTLGIWTENQRVQRVQRAQHQDNIATQRAASRHINEREA